VGLNQFSAFLKVGRLGNFMVLTFKILTLEDFKWIICKRVRPATWLRSLPYF